MTDSILPKFLASLIGCAMIVACSSEDATITSGPDVIVYNADIYTVDTDAPRATAFAVTDGKFVTVGASEDVLALAGDNTRQVNAGGKTITPGFIDGHQHFALGSNLTIGVDLSDIADKREWLRLVREKVAVLEEGEWLVGGGWNHLLSDGLWPTKEMLDEVAPDNPIMLRDIDYHNLWVNSKALEIAGVTAESPVPAGGIIVLNDGGEPSGILQEGAMYLVTDHPGAGSVASQEESLIATIAYLNSMGVTGAHNMNWDPSEDEAMMRLVELDQFNMRVWKGALFLEDRTVKEIVALRDHIDERMARIMVKKDEPDEPQFTLGYVKSIMDGVLSTHTALMHEPYSDRPDIVVEPLNTAEGLAPMVKAVNEAGMGVAIHAVGDKAVADTLDAYEIAGTSPNAPFPNRIEHLEIIKPEEIERFKSLNVVASMQPVHTECCVGVYVMDRVGMDRLKKGGYIYQTLLQNGVHLALGSDWPTASGDPLRQLDNAQERTALIDGKIEKWDDGSEALTWEQALYGYTQANADITAWKDEIGSITVGKWADFVILDDQVADEGLRDLTGISVESTWMSGEAVYEKH